MRSQCSEFCCASTLRAEAAYSFSAATDAATRASSCSPLWCIKLTSATASSTLRMILLRSFFNLAADMISRKSHAWSAKVCKSGSVSAWRFGRSRGGRGARTGAGGFIIASRARMSSIRALSHTVSSSTVPTNNEFSTKRGIPLVLVLSKCVRLVWQFLSFSFPSASRFAKTAPMNPFGESSFALNIHSRSATRISRLANICSRLLTSSSSNSLRFTTNSSCARTFSSSNPSSYCNSAAMSRLRCVTAASRISRSFKCSASFSSLSLISQSSSRRFSKRSLRVKSSSSTSSTFANAAADIAQSGDGCRFFFRVPVSVFPVLPKCTATRGRPRRKARRARFARAQDSRVDGGEPAARERG
mmetsp:Transcript_5847/g.22142  ORF Transcript_5847/g.22142 Transcript_5847/m.22142 type:complete len:359 (-) Transcript_5847:7-1083(-)